MAAKTKMGDALETLLRCINAGRTVSQRITLKMLLALLTLQQRYDEVRRECRKQGRCAGLACKPKADRVVLTATRIPLPALEDAGYRALAPRSLWKRQYGFITRLKGPKSIREIRIEHERNAHWLAPFRITLIPRDESGLLPGDFRMLLELLPDFKLVLVEIAFDFPLDSILDVDFVSRHLLSGKMWLKQAVNQDKYHVKWGAPTGSKAVRAYAKWEVSAMRVELELRAPFLRSRKINDIFDFYRLPAILAKDHIWFTQIDEAKLVARLRRNGMDMEEQRALLQQVKTREGSLWETLKFLRRTLRLTNVRRLLRPLDEINEVVEQGLRTWAAQWPAAPTRLGKKK
jgi:hypothetical protein